MLRVPGYVHLFACRRRVRDTSPNAYEESSSGAAMSDQRQVCHQLLECQRSPLSSQFVADRVRRVQTRFHSLFPCSPMLAAKAAVVGQAFTALAAVEHVVVKSSH